MGEKQSIELEQHLNAVQSIHRFHTQDKIDLFNAMRIEFGDKIFQVIEKTEGEKALREWQHIAKNCDSREIKDLINLLWEPLRTKGFEFTYEEKQEGIEMHCTRCPYHEMAKSLQAEEWLYYQICSVDPYIAEGFNPNIGLKRTKTLMQGDCCCNHFYYLQENKNEKTV